MEDSAEAVDHGGLLAHTFVSDHWQAAATVSLRPLFDNRNNGE